MMDNVNGIRVGFFAPEMKLADTEMEIGDPINRFTGRYTCLVFINPDDTGAKVLAEFEKGLPVRIGNIDWNISVIVPLKTKPVKTFREKHGFSLRMFCDSELKAGKLYAIVDSAMAKPAYHPTIFVIGDEGSVRYRQSINGADFDIMAFREALKSLV